MALDYGDRTDFENASRGFIATLEPLVIKDANGKSVFDTSGYTYLSGDCPDTVHPSLFRQAQLCLTNGLFEVTEGIYQIRGFDLSNMTLVEGDTGVIVIDPLISAETVVEMADMARGVHVDPSINDYVSRLVDASRSADEIRLGVSVRGALALVRASKTLAASSGRYYVTPDDVKALAEPVLAHRLVLDPEAEFEGVTASSVVGQLLIEVPPPSDRAAV